MIGKRRRLESDPTLEKARRRALKMSTGDLSIWAEQATYGISRHLADYRRRNSEEDLHEAHIASAALLAVVEELHKRNVSPSM